MTATLFAPRIDPVIQQWIAPLRADEYAALESSVRTEGCRDAIVLWNGTIIDGHHRFAICDAFGLPFAVHEMAFDDLDHVEMWVRQNQAARRNLTDDQRAVNADLLAVVEERIAKRDRAQAANESRWNPSSSAAVVDKDKPKKDSRKKAAKAHGVSERRLRRVRAIRVADPDLAEAIQRGTLTIKAAEKLLRDRTRATKRAAAATAAQATAGDTDRTIHHASFTTTARTIAPGSVALVFTDPPYTDQSLGVYADLGVVASRVLREGGSLITYTAHHRIPEVIAMLQAGGLTFFWPIAMVHTGAKARMTEYGIVVHWKPLLWFVKGPFRSRDDLRFVNDLIESTPQKDVHPWQQSVVEAQYYIEALTAPGDLVFDPFCGGGTTAVAAAQAMRQWITCDVDESAVWIARQRLREAVNG